VKSLSPLSTFSLSVPFLSLVRGDAPRLHPLPLSVSSSSPLLSLTPAPQQGWVQSYGSRYVRPPIIHADVTFSKPMTVREYAVAQQLTAKPVKGMLTGVCVSGLCCGRCAGWEQGLRKAGLSNTSEGWRWCWCWCCCGVWRQRSAVKVENRTAKQQPTCVGLCDLP
jgi:hypothetical protein